MDKVENSIGKSMYEMKAGENMVPKTCKYIDEKPNLQNPLQVDTAPKSKKRVESSSALLTFCQQSAWVKQAIKQLSSH